MRHRAYMINGGYADAEMFAAAISDLLAAGWTLAPPKQLKEQLELENVTDETWGDEPLG